MLREVPIFASFSVAAAEYMARNAVVLDVPASTILIREGEVGDRFYVVADGRFDVTRHGRNVTTEEAGGFFGEIALIRDVPRQATVTAAEDSTVYAFERNDFIAAVTGHALSREATHNLIESRLSINERPEKEDR
jgi:CRP-like cAMP-binding protein